MDTTCSYEPAAATTALLAFPLAHRTASDAGAVDTITTPPDVKMGGEPDLDATAHSIHAAYCRHFAKIGYMPFRDCWVHAARVVSASKADPVQFVEAQKMRGVEVDPEDLVTPTALDAYRKAYSALTKDLINMFQHSMSVLTSLTTHSRWEADGALYSPMISLQAAFRVVRAKLICAPEVAAAIIHVYGDIAADEIRSSQHFREYLELKHPQLDMQALLEDLDRAAKTWSGSGSAHNGVADDHAPNIQG